jgi:hypothetical protein
MVKLLIVVVIIMAIALKLWNVIRKTIKTATCKHEKYYENMRCHARCLNCRKDLGFIQISREQNPKGETGSQRYEFD